MKKLILILLFPLMANAGMRSDVETTIERAGYALGKPTSCAVSQPDAATVKVSCMGPDYDKATVAVRKLFEDRYAVADSGLGFTVTGKALVVVK